MANLTFETSIDSSGSPIYLTDTTVWGTPAEERADVALLAIAEVHTVGGAPALIQSSGVDYDPTYPNNHQSKFIIYNTIDGVYYLHLLQLNIDAVTTPDGNYYYDIVDEKVYLRDSIGGDTPIEPEQYQALLGFTAAQADANEFFTPLLDIKEGELYKEYREARTTCTGELEILDTIYELNLNLEHARSLFNINLFNEAQSVIETQNNTYNL